MPRQVMAMARQVLGEARDKRGLDIPGASTTVTDFDAGNIQGTPPNLSLTTSQGRTSNPNYQQPFYQANAFGPGAPQLVPDTYFPRPPIFLTVTGNPNHGMPKNVRDQLTRTLQEFGLEPN
jgi:hypothetical protein